jgi:hypothetical protein
VPWLKAGRQAVNVFLTNIGALAAGSDTPQLWLLALKLEENMSALLVQKIPAWCPAAVALSNQPPNVHCMLLKPSYRLVVAGPHQRQLQKQQLCQLLLQSSWQL